ncbi:T9SS type A sorting domain-containing protein [candidate division KSB1 bacterium]|nr:T9SS type A sorting domain-containing protein [candidate division KSB1 bacterium]
MVNKKLLIILFSLTLLFSFIAASFAKNASTDVQKKDKAFKSVINMPNVNSVEARNAAKKALMKSRGLTSQQVINKAKNRNAVKANQELAPVTIDDVPGGGDIFPVLENTFDSQEDFDQFDLLDLSTEGWGNDWFWFKGSDYGWPNSAFAPEPGGDFGGNVEPRDEVMQIRLGIPKVADNGLPYRVASLAMNFYVGEPDPDDSLGIDLMEAPKWHVDNDVWVMTSNQYGSQTYGAQWVDDLITAPITLGSGPITLSFNHLIVSEIDWDGGNVKISTDAGATWTVIVPNEGYDIDDLYAFKYHGGLAQGLTEDDFDFGVPTAWDQPGYSTDSMHDFAAATFDLSAYAGQTVQIKWEWASDGGYQEPGGGWWIDDIVITDGGTDIFANDGVDNGDLVAKRLGIGFAPERWEYLASIRGYGAALLTGSVNLTENLIGAPGDSVTLRFRAVYDDNDEGTSADPNWGFEVYDATLTVYTRLAEDIGPTFVDLDSTFTNGGTVTVGETYDPQVVISNFSLSDFTIYNTFVKIMNQFGSPVYERYIYTYAPAQGDTLFLYPGYQEFNDDQGFYNFPDWTPEYEGDYTLLAYTEVFGGDDEPLNDSLLVNFHAYTEQPVYMENFEGMTDDELNAEWTQTNGTFFIGDVIGNGDDELSAFEWPSATPVSDLIMSPSIDCSALTNTGLRMDHWWRAAQLDPNNLFNILVTTDGGATYDTVITMGSDAVTPSSVRYGIHLYDISEFADGQSDVRIAFDYSIVAGVNFFLQVDDIEVYGGADFVPTDAAANFTGVSGDMKVDLSWDAVAGASYYTAWVAPDADLDNAVAAVEVSAKKCTVTGLTNDDDYYFWLTVTDFNNNISDPVGPIMVTPKDVTAPTKITDLLAEELDAPVKKITWSAPAESVPAEGSTYDIRYAYEPITAENWATATPVTNDLEVAAEGTEQSLEVSVARPTFDVWFAIVTVDEAGNASEMSNVALADDTPPGKITDLEVVEVTATTVTLKWHAKGDDGVQGGPADHFDIRVAYEELDQAGMEATWEKAAKMTALPKPADPGEEQVYTASEFVYTSSKMTFIMKVIDNKGTESEFSNIVVSDVWEDNGNSVEQEQKLPETFDMAQNYPNPFNPTTAISYQLPKASFVKLTIYSATGQKIRTLVNGTNSAGYHHINWDAMDDAGHKVASGIYFYRIEADDFISIKKMTLMK